MTGLTAALGYAALGVYVFPCGADKHPLTTHGFLDASVDPDRIRSWWARHPDALVGVATGRTGLVVVDLDVKDGEDGPGNWKLHLNGHSPPPATYTVTTPSGGRHLWYRDPDSRFETNAGKIAGGVDIRAVGGYVIGAGSPGYTWDAEMPLSLDEIPVMPPGVVPETKGPSGGHWKPLDRAALHPLDLATLSALEALGGHGAILSGNYVAVTRPGKHAGSSASIGYSAPGTARVFTSNWPKLKERLYTLDEIDTIVEGGPVDAESDPATEAALDAAAEFARAVERQAYDLRVREAARAKVAAENTPEAPPFDAGLLVELLARPAEPPHRVQDLIPTDAAVLVVAMRKTGKTTLQLNLARCLLTGERFLDKFDVRPVTGRVGFLNYEVSAATLAAWADEVGVPRDRFYQVNLRGRRNPLAFHDDRALLAAQLREHHVESLIVDPFGRAYTGKSQNDSGEVGAWLAELDRFARGDAGCTDLVLSAHAGWEGERTRGASALEDWADAIVTLTRDKDDDSVRYLRATGRDVEVDEDRLHYEHASRHLRLTGAGSRKASAKTRHLDELVPAVVAVVQSDGGITGYKLASALRECEVPFQRGDEIKAVRLAVERGLLRFEHGPRNSKRYFPTSTYPDLPRPTPTGEVLTYPDLPLVSGGGQQGYVNGPPTPDAVERPDVAAEPIHEPEVVDRADCPSCLHQTAGPPGRGCNAPDLHPTGVML